MDDELAVTKCGQLTREMMNSEFIRKLTNFDYVHYEDISDNETFVTNQKLDVLNIIKQIKDQVYIKDYVAYWKSNSRIIPKEYAYLMTYMEIEINGKFINLKKHLAMEKEESQKTLEKISKEQMNHKYSDEEIFEMQAAFGEGATVVNILTGEKIKLPKRKPSLLERNRAKVYATGNKWAIENFEATH